VDVAIAGSFAASNSLFRGLQVPAGHDAGISPTPLAAGNSTAGVLAKMRSPQHLAIAAVAAGMAGLEGDIMRSVLKWSVGLVVMMCALVFLQSTALLSWWCRECGRGCRFCREAKVRTTRLRHASAVDRSGRRAPIFWRGSAHAASVQACAPGTESQCAERQGGCEVADRGV
jgi:hypothetical protein